MSLSPTFGRLGDKKMNLEERGRQWAEASAKGALWVQESASFAADNDCAELAMTEEHPTLMYVDAQDDPALIHSRVRDCRMSPLGIAVWCMVRHGTAIRLLLEKGADPHAPALMIEYMYDIMPPETFSAFDITVERANWDVFRILLDYATPLEFPTIYLKRIKLAQNAAGHAITWLFTQIQREDLVQPVMRRLARIPLHDWDLSSKKMKTKK